MLCYTLLSSEDPQHFPIPEDCRVWLLTGLTFPTLWWVTMFEDVKIFKMLSKSPVAISNWDVIPSSCSIQFTFISIKLFHTVVTHIYSTTCETIIVSVAASVRGYNIVRYYNRSTEVCLWDSSTTMIVCICEYLSVCACVCGSIILHAKPRVNISQMSSHLSVWILRCYKFKTENGSFPPRYFL